MKRHILVYEIWLTGNTGKGCRRCENLVIPNADEGSSTDNVELEANHCDLFGQDLEYNDGGIDNERCPECLEAEREAKIILKNMVEETMAKKTARELEEAK